MSLHTSDFVKGQKSFSEMTTRWQNFTKNAPCGPAEAALRVAFPLGTEDRVFPSPPADPSLRPPWGHFRLNTNGHEGTGVRPHRRAGQGQAQGRPNVGGTLRYIRVSRGPHASVQTVALHCVPRCFPTLVPPG